MTLPAFAGDAEDSTQEVPDRSWRQANTSALVNPLAIAYRLSVGVPMKHLLLSAVAAFAVVDVAVVGNVLAPSVLRSEVQAQGAKDSTSSPPQRARQTSIGEKTPGQQSDFEGRQAEAVRTIRAVQDKSLTGDPQGRAEWLAADNQSMTCGVTPEGRYLIVRNEIGKTRYDENIGSNQRSGINFAVEWDRAKCEVTAPIHQQELLAKAAEKRFYSETHPADLDCIAREAERLAAAGLGEPRRQEAKRQLAQPNLCRLPRDVWEKALPEPAHDGSFP